MPAGKRGPYKKRVAKRVPRGIGGMRRRMLYNPQPVFTETYKGTQISAGTGAGFLLTANMDSIGQLAQYSNLYTKYKILKVVFTLLPTFNGTDQNNALWNNSQTTMATGTTRIVYSYDNSPDAAGPATEAIALQENGCKIKMLKDKLVIPCRPVPDLKDANNNRLTQTGKYINFVSPNIAHYGVRGWISQPQQLSPNFRNDIDVYVKITFQLSDPR